MIESGVPDSCSELSTTSSSSKSESSLTLQSLFYLLESQMLLSQLSIQWVSLCLASPIDTIYLPDLENRGYLTSSEILLAEKLSSLSSSSSPVLLQFGLFLLGESSKYIWSIVTRSWLRTCSDSICFM